jgi:hypothetical protein
MELVKMSLTLLTYYSRFTVPVKLWLPMIALSFVFTLFVFVRPIFFYAKTAEVVIEMESKDKNQHITIRIPQQGISNKQIDSVQTLLATFSTDKQERGPEVAVTLNRRLKSRHSD